MKTWNELSIKDKNDIIRVAVQNGITTLPDIRERYNEFAEGGEEETIERVLPEVVKTPSEEDKLSLAKIKRMLPDAESRSDMYYELDPFRHLADEPIKISQNESIDRLYDVYKQSGYPKVSNHRTVFDYLTYPFSKDLNRPSYDPITNTMHLPNSEEAKYDAEGFIPELAHAYQFYGNNAHFWRDLFHIPGDVKLDGKSGYERPGHMEHTAHSIIEPAIFNYVQGYTDSFNPQVYANGGKIHIKPENRGKFTALKKRTGHSASWFKAHGTPAQKKMATFALNSRKWKHEDGGYLFDEGGHKFSNTPVGRAMQRQYDLEQSEEAPAIMINEDEAIKTKPLPEVVVYGSNWKNDLLKKLPKPVVGGIMNTARAAHWTGKIELPSFYGLTKNADNYYDPAVAALFDYARQEEFMENKGYHRADDYDYGLVNRAAKRHGYPPIYQLNGKDAISRDSLDVLTNDRTFFIDFGNGPKKVSVNVPFDDANWYPTALYKHKNKNEYYKKGWDLEDFGNYDNEGGVNYKGTSETGNVYPSYMQGLANMLDVVGHPYVRRTPIIAMPELDGFIWNENTKTFTKPSAEYIDEGPLVEMAMGDRLNGK